ncbi:YcxB family protein [Actinoplanes sp. GCM10030250]|uniref:YcxB family protein n=1 Tax=Actinoplanes sp. GCM10030250 TaxID=3273376 RepID=UPI00361C9FBC
MQIQITAAPDPALIEAATRHGLRQPLLLARLAGWATLAMAFVVQLAGGGLSLPLLTLGVVLAVLVPMMLLNHGVRRGVRAGQVTTFEFSDDGLASSDAESRHSYAWRAFRSVEMLSGQLVFRLGGARLLPVPTAGLTAAEINQVLVLAAAGGLPVRRR